MSDFDPGRTWCEIASDGRITFIDWDEAERLAELHRSGGRRDDNTSIASLAVGVRDLVLSVEMPKTQGGKNQ